MPTSQVPEAPHDVPGPEQPQIRRAANPGWYPQADGSQRYWDGQQWLPNPQVSINIAAPPVAPKKSWVRRHKILTGLGVLILLIFVVSRLAGGGNSSPAATPAASSTSTAAAKRVAAAGLNSPVRDGKFEFTVSAMVCGQPHVGTGALTKAAQGQFCIVSLSVKNIGDIAQTLDAGSQQAFDAQNRTFSADTAAGIYLGDQGNTFLNEINPGNAVTGKVVFDVPKDAKITRLELHDSPFSGGIPVTVG